MMRLWTTRYQQRAAFGASAAGSAVVHAVLIGGWVIATLPRERPERPLPDNPIVRFLAPPNRSGSQPVQREVIRYVAIAIPVAAAAAAPLVELPPAVEPRVAQVHAADVPARVAVAGTDSVFSVIEVDSAASRYEWSAAPVFPPAMLAERRSGFVRAEWVVDERGMVDTLTFRVVEASHPEFARAVRDALPFMRFRPATMGNRAVSQLVQQPFHFQITAAAGDSAVRRPWS